MTDFDPTQLDPEYEHHGGFPEYGPASPGPGFGRFVAAYMVLMATGFVIYLLFPEMPPWLASQNGLLPHVHRIVVESLQQLGGFGGFYAGADPEPNAAMPSLHVAVPMLIACAAIGKASKHRGLAWLWMLYPLTIGF